MRIGDICDVVRGSSPRPQGDPRYYGGNIPRLMIADVTRDGMYVTPRIDALTEEGAVKSRPMKKGDVVIAVSGDPGRACILNVDACIHDGFVGLRNLDESRVFKPYLIYFLSFFKNKTKKGAVGAIFKNLTTDQIKNVEIPDISFNDQHQVASILSKAEALVGKRKESIRLLDELLKSTFLEMFGDPIKNERGWEQVTLNSFGKIITGNTPSRNEKSNFSTQFIEWVKTDNILDEDVFVTTAEEYLSEVGAIKARMVSEGALLVACIAGSVNSIGRAALANRRLAFNQQINALQPNNDISPFYLYWLFKICRIYIQSHATKGMKKILTKGDFEKIVMIKPPYSLQVQFAYIVEKAETQKALYQQSLQELENLYGALSQKAFKGELVAVNKAKII